MTKLPSWLESLTDAELNRVFGAATVARGRQYATLGRVSAVKTVGELATATVLTPISLQARITRTAISPRFAINIFGNKRPPSRWTIWRESAS